MAGSSEDTSSFSLRKCILLGYYLQRDCSGVDVFLGEAVTKLFDAGGDFVKEHLLPAAIAFDDVHFLEAKPKNGAGDEVNSICTATSTNENRRIENVLECVVMNMKRRGKESSKDSLRARTSFTCTVQTQ